MVWGPWQIFVRAGRVVACTALLVACASVQNNPVNVPLAEDGAPVAAQLGSGVRGLVDTPDGIDDGANYDETVVAMSFSGGGTRAAAYSYGVLTGLEETQVRNTARGQSLLDHVAFVSGVSGGSITAAYYGLKKRAAMADFKQRFLLRNPEQGLQMDLSLLNIAKGLQGGVNDSTQLPRWLDDNLFEHATFKSLITSRWPRVWINASDIYNRTPFVFGRTTFGALCSDLSSFPVSLAVGASAAVPVVFAPVVIKNFTGGCPLPLPHWVQQVRKDPSAPPLLKIYANALERYRSGEVRYVKLLDGGIVDNYGLAPITIARLVADTPYEPLSPREAVKLRRLFFAVVDAGRGPSGSWVQTVEGPTGANLITAASDTATESGAVGSFSTFEDMMNTWQERLIKWRCGLSAAERQRYGAPAGWNCRDARLFLTRLSFDDLGPERSAALNAVETRFKLPPDQVDMLISAGHDVLITNGVFRKFLNSLGPGAAPPPRNGPVATPTAHLQQAEAH
jgi:NTE family protein